jgi:3-phosphoshikimate 1-carboxyvinyltransferase
VTFLKILPIIKLKKNQIFVPGSKSYSNRALILATLNSKTSILKGICEGFDTQILIKNLKKIGINIQEISPNELKVYGNSGVFSYFKGELFTDNSGISSRFLVSLCSLIKGEVVVKAGKRMQERPMKDLFKALENLGSKIDYLEQKNYLPARFLTKEIIYGGKINISGNLSSQFLSSLLLISPILKKGLNINIIGDQISKSYIQSTIEVMQELGIKVINNNFKSYKVDAQKITFDSYQIPGDLTGAGYFWALAAISGQKIKTLNTSPTLTQGDIKLPKILEEMGCDVKYNYAEKSIEVDGSKNLKPIEVNMQDLPDSAQTLAVVCAFAKGKSKLNGLSTLRLKETDRLLAVSNELQKMNIKTEIEGDSLIIFGGNPKPAEIETYDDHRMAMSFALAGSKIEGMKIKNPEVVNKSLPSFWNILKELGLESEPGNS